MAKYHGSPRTPVIPPGIPNMPDVSTTLTNYLNGLSLWAKNQLANKPDINTAQNGVLLMANDAPAGTTPAVFLLQVNSAGVLVITPQDLGTGAP